MATPRTASVAIFRAVAQWRLGCGEQKEDACMHRDGSCGTRVGAFIEVSRPLPVAALPGQDTVKCSTMCADSVLS